MTGCNATLHTHTVTDDVVATHCNEADPSPAGHFHPGEIPDGATVRRQGDRLVHVETHTLTCERTNADHAGWDHCAGSVAWHDDTPGATPHVAPLVSDVEVDAALSVWTSKPWNRPVDLLRAALEAAAEARQP